MGNTHTYEQVPTTDPLDGEILPPHKSENQKKAPSFSKTLPIAIMLIIMFVIPQAPPSPNSEFQIVPFNASNLNFHSQGNEDFVSFQAYFSSENLTHALVNGVYFEIGA